MSPAAGSEAIAGPAGLAPFWSSDGDAAVWATPVGRRGSQHPAGTAQLGSCELAPAGKLHWTRPSFAGPLRAALAGGVARDHSYPPMLIRCRGGRTGARRSQCGKSIASTSSARRLQRLSWLAARPDSLPRDGIAVRRLRWFGAAGDHGGFAPTAARNLQRLETRGGDLPAELSFGHAGSMPADLSPELAGPVELALARAVELVPAENGLPGGSLYELK